MKKRTLILLISIFSAGFVQLSLQAKTFNLTEFNIQTIEKKIDTVEIKTSAVCNMCKERLEHNMAFEKGVKSVELDNDTKVLAITYKTNKTNEDELKKAVTKIGYDADELMADQKAHDRLPACCQKGTEPH
jgi:copper chaperone CopZ